MPASEDDLKKALKAFKKRLKLTQLEDDSKLGHSPLTGAKSQVVAIQPPTDRVPPPDPTEPDSPRVYAMTYWPSSVEVGGAKVLNPQEGDEVSGLEWRSVGNRGAVLRPFQSPEFWLSG